MRESVLRAGSVVGFLLIWQLASVSGIVPKFLLVGPIEIARTGVDMLWNGDLARHIGASMSRVAVGYGIALVTGIALGMLMGWYRTVDSIVDPIVELVRPVSPLALLPLSILWFGIHEPSKWFVIWYGCFFPILINTFSGVRGVPRSTIEAALTLGADSREMLVRVILQHALPMMLTGARISFAVGMIVMVAAEMINANRGLGYLIHTSQQTFKTTELFVGIVTIAIIGYAGDRLLRRIRAWLCPWHLETARTQTL